MSYRNFCLNCFHCKRPIIVEIIRFDESWWRYVFVEKPVCSDCFDKTKANVIANKLDDIMPPEKLQWMDKSRAEWQSLSATLEPQTPEQKEQYESCVKDYLNGVHHQLFDALMQTRSEQSKDVQARRVVEILLSQREK